MRLLIFIFILFPFLAQAQEAHYLFENDADDELGNHNATVVSGSYNSVIEKQGTYCLSLEYADGQVSCGTVDLGEEFTITAWVLKYAITGTVIIWSNRATASGGGIEVTLNCATGVVTVTTSDGSNTSTATSNASSYTPNTWNFYAITVDRAGAEVAIRWNTTDVTSTTTCQDDFDNNQTFYLGNRGDASVQPYYYMDEVQIYKCILTSTQCNNIYTILGTVQACPTEELFCLDSINLGDISLSWTYPDTIQLTWNDIGCETKYYVYMSTSGGAYSKEDSTTASDTVITIGGLNSIYYYLFKVYAVNDTAVSSTYLTASSSGLSYRDIGHYQVAICPDDAVAGDYVVELNYNKNWRVRDNSSGVVFAETNSNAYFDISDTTIIVVSAATAGTIETIEFTVTDSNFVDTASVDIYIIDNNDCVYIDYEWDGTKSGTRAAPYKDIPTLNAANTYYLLKRGVTHTTAYKTIGADGITLGSYGQGARPIFSCTTSGGGDIGAIYIPNRSDITIRDIEVYDGGSMTAVIRPYTCTDFIIDNVKLRGKVTVQGGTGTFNGLRITNNVVSGGMKNSEVCYIGDDATHGFGVRGTDSDDRFMWESNYVHHINMYWTPSYPSGGDGWHITGQDYSDVHWDNSHSHWRYNYVDMTNMPYKHGILAGMGDYGYDTCDIIIEYNRIDNYEGYYAGYGQHGISLYSAYGAIVRYNEMYNSTCGIFTPTDAAVLGHQPADKGRRYSIYGNLIYNPKSAGILLQYTCDSATIENNTIVHHSPAFSGETDKGGIILKYGCYGVTITNNIFETEVASTYPIKYVTTYSSYSEDYNLFDPDKGSMSSINTHSVEGDAVFYTGDHSDYEIGLLSPAYHTGYDIDLDLDLWGDSFDPDTPSMGYKEYITPEPVIITETPATRRTKVYLIFL
jgi:hypothetical protein